MTSHHCGRWVWRPPAAQALKSAPVFEYDSLKEAAFKFGYIDETRFDAIVDPKQMVGHGVAGS